MQRLLLLLPFWQSRFKPQSFFWTLIHCVKLTLLVSMRIHFTEVFCNVHEMRVFGVTKLVASQLKMHSAKLIESSWLFTFCKDISLPSGLKLHPWCEFSSNFKFHDLSGGFSFA